MTKLVKTKKKPTPNGIPIKPVMGTDPRTRGLNMPVKNKGNFNQDLRHAWFHTVEQLMGVGITSPSEITLATGLSDYHARGFIKEVEEAWALSMSPALVNTRREKIYREIESIKNEAWGAYLNGRSQGSDPKELGAWLKLILESTQHQARLSGLNYQPPPETPTEINVRIKSAQEMSDEAHDLLGEEIDADLMEEIATALAKKNSVQ